MYRGKGSKGFGKKKGMKKGKKGDYYKQKTEDLKKEDENFPDDELDQTPDVKPQFDQEVLPPEKRESILTKVLTTNNPQAPHNNAVYNYKDRAFKKDDLVDQLIIHFALDGNILLKDTEEFRDQEELLEEKRMNNEKQIKTLNEGITDESGEPIKQDQTDLKKSLRNQFNFSERAAQAFTNPIKFRGVETEPPPVTTFSRDITQWQIFDEFMQRFDEEKAAEAGEPPEEEKKKPAEDPLYSASMKKCLKIMERIVLHNTYAVKFSDYKYYEDKSDDSENHHGSALPLWRYLTDKNKKKQVTALCWNPKYKDLFAVGYGTYEFAKSGTIGAICCFSIKNPVYPEYYFQTDSDVMCLNFHPQRPALLAVGLYDGTVLVYDVRNKSTKNKPIYQSTVRTKKHTDPVWQILWQKEDINKQLNFYSISSDGRVTNWMLMKNKLEPEDLIKLKLVPPPDKEAEASLILGEIEEESALCGLAGGMCFDFNKFQEHLFLVGTEEGRIHLCSKAYSGQYMETYEGHILAVYSVKWNNFHPRVFLSCSADWTIKMWDMNSKKPISTFDLQNPINDIEWAPFSSTVFGAVSSQAFLYVYDLNVEKHTYLCDQRIVKKTKLTHLAFNLVDPILIVGDDRGGVTSLRLSPNLRGPLRPPEKPLKEEKEKDKEKEKPKKQIVITEIDPNSEREKMERFLAMQDRELY